MIRVRCPHCGSRFKVRPEWAGRKGKCPNPDCRQTFLVAAETEAPPQLDPWEIEDPEPAAPPPVVRRSKSGAARHGSEPPARSQTRRKGKGKAGRRSSRQWLLLGGATAGVILLAAIGLLIPFGGAGGDAKQALAATPVAENAVPFQDVLPFFQKYCFDCHSGADAEGGFALEKFQDTAGVLRDRHRWERVFKLVKVGNMPPPDVDQPSEKDRERIVEWLDHTLYFVDCSVAPDPGHVTTRRLNRSEYNNTIRDLLGVDFQPAADFPSDDVGYGFDNIGDVLTVPPLLIEKYLVAAEEVSTRAILTTSPDYFTETFAGRDMRPEGSVSDADEKGRIFVSRGTLSRRVTFPRKGEYLVRIEAAADQGGNELAKMELAIEGAKPQVIDVKGQRKRDFYETRVTADGDRRRLAITFLNDFYDAEKKEDRNLIVYTVTVEGPLGLPEDLPRAHRQLLATRPDGQRSVADAALANLKPLLRRAFRRPVTDDQVAPYVGFVQKAIERGASFERAMQVALQAVLVSPEFLFRVEPSARGSADQAPVALNDHELATRLSYFLWASMPDDELFGLADAGTLHDPAVLQAQVRRMLKDPRADALVSNFAGQWLNLRKLGTNEVAPDPAVFPDFTDELRKDIWKETELFVGSVMREDRPLTDLLTAQYTFANERTAKLYGLEGVKGTEFRRVDLPGSHRSGLVTQPSILTLTSYPSRTSPVKRGEWVLSNLLGDAPPEPPPVVPALDETQQAHPELSLRQQLVLHRADPGCASCHKVMDEIGFGLENFDAIGRWREQDGPHAIDSVGTLPTGERFSGPSELVALVAGRKDEFARCLSEKMLTYALGRGLEYYDRCAVQEIVRGLQQDDYRFSTLVLGIVNSVPFKMTRGATAPAH